MLTLNVTLKDDPVQAAEWVATFHEHSSAAGATLHQEDAAERAGLPADREDRELQTELERFRQNWPAYSKRFSRLHEGLVAMGYRPVLPTKRKPTSVRSYIAYHLPGGQRVLENNSSTAYFVGTERRSRLRNSHEWLKDSGQNVSVHFDTVEKVDFILQLAREEMR